MRLIAGSASDVGRLRSINEDSVLVADGVFAVADGMGGHRGGEVASARALAAFAAAVGDRSEAALVDAVLAANRDVFEHARTSPDLAGMGTTLCAIAALDDGHVAVLNVGDSRVYLLVDGALGQVSDDHSFVESLVRDGVLTRAQADVHPQRNVLTRALGIEPHIEVDSWKVAVRDGARFLLCSDGLFNEVAEPVIESTLSSVADPGDAAARLVAMANENGGRDNVSCIVVDVTDVGPGAPDPAAITAGRPIETAAPPDSPPPASDSPADDDPTTVDEPIVPDGPVPSVLRAPTGLTAETPSSRHRRVGWRTVVFLLAILLTFGVALGATAWYYDNTYTVVDRGGKVAIRRGPEQSFIWFHPAYEPGVPALLVRDLPSTDYTKVTEGYSGSRAATHRYVDRLDRRLSATTTTTTTTTTTSTTTTTTTAPTAPTAPAG